MASRDGKQIDDEDLAAQAARNEHIRGESVKDEMNRVICLLVKFSPLILLVLGGVYFGIFIYLGQLDSIQSSIVNIVEWLVAGVFGGLTDRFIIKKNEK